MLLTAVLVLVLVFRQRPAVWISVGILTAVLLPVVVSLVAVSMLFRMIMNPDTGTLNRLLSAVHLRRFQITGQVP